MCQREYQEWASLWEALFGEPPPIAAEIALTARILIECLPAAEPYEPAPIPPGS